MLDSKQKGNLTELQCLVEFAKLGIKTSLPYGENCRYDFIIDINGHLLKVQSKTSHKLENGEGFEFKCESVVVTTTKPTSTKYSLNEIDFFATIDNDKCYLVPVEECGCRKTLRYVYPRNGQKKGISLAENYELEKVIKQFE